MENPETLATLGILRMIQNEDILNTKKHNAEN